MRVDVSMEREDEFHASAWWAKKPEFVVNTLRKQLEAAQAIWPELAEYQIVRGRSRKERGVKGGTARAAALSPERRSEIASTAAKERWKDKAPQGADNQ